jgi:drug/metabolite transporter (DMT)-like permease
VLFLLSVLLREAPVTHISTAVVLSMVFQGLVIAFFSYLLWFFMVHTYPVSRLSAFTFLTPVFATLAGVLFLGEKITATLAIALIFVSLGIYIVNRDAP